MTVSKSPHALVVTSYGQGHVNSAFLLSQSLISTGFSVSIAIFSTTYSSLEKNGRLPSFIDPSIRIHVVTDDLDPENRLSFFAFTALMQHGLEELIESLHRQDPITCLISDTFIAQVQDVADKFGLPRIDYWTSNAFSYLMVTNVGLLYSKGILPAKGSQTQWKSEGSQMIDVIPDIPPFPVGFFPQSMRFQDASSPMMQFFSTTGDYAKRADRVLIHTLQELENTPLAAIEKAGIPAYPIGPLLPFARSQNASAPKEEECVRWLDAQADDSVIYVAFGSLASVSLEDLKELASGLEASKQAFLWVIRADGRAHRELSEVLPEGFLERTKERGKIVEWAPQVEVLKHPAVGGFLTHCGWNSTFESIWEGIPLLACPKEAEQIANAHHIVEEWKIGIELERTEDGGLERRDVEKGVRGLMQQEEGHEAKRRAKELQAAARKAWEEGGQSKANVQKFYEDMCSRISA